jgi:hypothetical protein
MDRVQAFPTLIFLDKNAEVRKVHSYFTGPATGIYYQNFKQEFEKIIMQLLAE